MASMLDRTDKSCIIDFRMKAGPGERWRRRRRIRAHESDSIRKPCHTGILQTRQLIRVCDTVSRSLSVYVR
jgi:hypothetical protein